MDFWANLYQILTKVERTATYTKTISGRIECYERTALSYLMDQSQAIVRSMLSNS
jgi:hypothetical protein